MFPGVGFGGINLKKKIINANLGVRSGRFRLRKVKEHKVQYDTEFVTAGQLLPPPALRQNAHKARRSISLIMQL